jgi:transcriptional regulator with XRE-family HTH domain
MPKKRENTGSGFAQRLKRTRATKGLSQQELADQIDLHPNQISRYEKGLSQPTAETLQKLAEVLDVSGDYLLAGDTKNGARANFEDQELLHLFQKASTLSSPNKDMLKRFVYMLFNEERIEEMKTGKNSA